MVFYEIFSGFSKTLKNSGGFLVVFDGRLVVFFWVPVATLNQANGLSIGAIKNKLRIRE